MKRFKIGITRTDRIVSESRIRQIEAENVEEFYPKMVDELKNLLISEGIRIWWEEVKTVTVCDKCLRASCWRGEFHCDHAREAGTTVKTVEELRTLNLESPDYWKEST